MFDRAAFASLLIAEEYNTRIKHYGDEVAQVMLCSEACWHPGGERPQSGSGQAKNPPSRPPKGEASEGGDAPSPEDVQRAKRRASSRLFDLAACNPDLCWFWTFTQSPDEVNRYDYKDLMRRLRQWLDNRVRRSGLKYIAVIERHKDGALHLHALTNDALKKQDSGRKWQREGIWKTVWNCPQWKWGFTTGVEMTGTRERYCRYVSKYISKGEKVGGRYFLHGGSLAEPWYTYTNMDYEAAAARREFKIEGTRKEFKIL